MRRKSAHQHGQESPIDAKQRELDRRAEQLKAQLNQTKDFLEKAPNIKAEVQRKKQLAIVDRYSRPARIEGPGDFRMDLIGRKSSSPPPRLRKERSKAPLLTVFLVIAFGVVIYYACRVLWQG